MSGERRIRDTKSEPRNSKIETRRTDAESPISSFQFPFWNFHFRISNFESRFLPWLASAIAALATFASATLVYAQGCALCYNTASAMKAAGITALRHGILILLIPPLAICLGVFYVGYRSRDHYNDPAQWDSDEQLGIVFGPGRVELLTERESDGRSQESGVSIQESVAGR